MPDDQEFESFIIGQNEDGSPRIFSSNPKNLANNFGKNKESPHYLTPVHFSKDVLDKYYGRPDKYSVEDGCVRNQLHWSMPIDNNSSDRVIAYLGDLGRDLPNSEQLYWKSFNILPKGTISEVAYNRDFLAEFTDPSAPDLAFKSRYGIFQEEWSRKFGWHLFRPLIEADSHVFEQHHVPSEGNKSEFERQILYLAKLTIDSLNVDEISKYTAAENANEKSLKKLEKFLEWKSYASVKRDLQVLRNIQAIRSQSSAHRKGSAHIKIAEKLDLDWGGPAKFCKSLFERLCLMIDGLTDHFLRSQAPDS